MGLAVVGTVAFTARHKAAAAAASSESKSEGSLAEVCMGVCVECVEGGRCGGRQRFRWPSFPPKPAHTLTLTVTVWNPELDTPTHSSPSTAVNP